MNDKEQLAAIGAEMAEKQQQPLCMAKRIEELEAQVRVMGGALNELRKFAAANTWDDDERGALLASIDALLAGQVTLFSHDQSLLDWAVTSWHEQVARRPMENVYRRTLDSVWRQVIRFAGEDPQSIIGPSHDDLLHAAPKPEAK